MIDQLLDKRLIFVTGKGGVGKSSCTAALAEALVRVDRRVLVVETDAYSAMTDLIGAPPSSEAIRVRDRLWAVNLQADECLVQTMSRFLGNERIVRALTQNRVTQAFFKSAPSVNEFVLLDQIRTFADQEETYDHVIVDLPASGHAVTFLTVPKTLHGMMRGIGPIAKRAAELDTMISDPSWTAISAVCLPEEMPVNETIELADRLETALGRGLDVALVNMVHRAPVSPVDRDAFSRLRSRFADQDPAELLAREDANGLSRLVAGNALALDWFDRDRHYLDVLHEDLDAAIIEIPMFYEVDDRRIVDRVATHLLEPNATDADTLAS